MKLAVVCGDYAASTSESALPSGEVPISNPLAIEFDVAARLLRGDVPPSQ